MISKQVLRVGEVINDFSLRLSVAAISFAPAVAFAAPGDGFDDTPVANVACAILEFVESSFGALILIVSGLISIIAAAMGAYRAAMSCLVIAVGAFVLRAFVGLFFGEIC